MADAQEFPSVFGEFLREHIFFGEMFDGMSENGGHTCLFRYMNICRASLNQFEPSARRPRIQTASSGHGKC